MRGDGGVLERERERERRSFIGSVDAAPMDAVVGAASVALVYAIKATGIFY